MRCGVKYNKSNFGYFMHKITKKEEEGWHQIQYKKLLNTPENYDNIVKYMNKFMEEALKEASAAFLLGEVPIGAVIEKDGQIIARAHNLTETLKDPTAHAEILAIRQAAKALGGWRLNGCSLYVTIEPCSMCAGAMVWARINHLYIGAMDPKAGACGSVLQIPMCSKLNHHINVETGIMEEACSQIMREFFTRLRNRKKNSKSEE